MRAAQGNTVPCATASAATRRMQRAPTVTMHPVTPFTRHSRLAAQAFPAAHTHAMQASANSAGAPTAVACAMWDFSAPDAQKQVLGHAWRAQIEFEFGVYKRCKFGEQDAGNSEVEGYSHLVLRNRCGSWPRFELLLQ